MNWIDRPISNESSSIYKRLLSAALGDNTSAREDISLSGVAHYARPHVGPSSAHPGVLVQ